MALPRKQPQDAPRHLYWTLTHRASYNFITGLLLLLLYETCTLLFVDERYQAINLIDGLFGQLLNALPIPGLYLSIGVAVVGVAIVVLDMRKGVRVQGSFIGLMLAESLGWGILTFLFLPNFVAHLLPDTVLANQALAAPLGNSAGGPTGSWFQNVVLSFGAGFYEEFFFRYLMVKAILLIGLMLSPDAQKWPLRLTAALVSALVFSLAHHFAEPFTWYAFGYRTIFGILMSLLVLLRGFGVTAWAHAWYDVLVFTFMAVG